MKILRADNGAPKYSLHFVKPCHFQVPSSFQGLIVKEKDISVPFVSHHARTVDAP